MSIERVVTVLTPGFSAVSAWLTGWVVTHFPSAPHVPVEAVTTLEALGFTAAATAALRWLHVRKQFLLRGVK